MPFVVDEASQRESNYDADDVFPVQHFSEGTCVENAGNFFLKNSGSYARREDVPHKNANGADQSNGEPSPCHGYGYGSSVMVALPAAPL
jgi:hypothetical protein